MKERIKQACPGRQKPLDALKNMAENRLKNNVIHENVVLIIVHNHVKYQDTIILHEILYRTTFPKIIYCGHEKKSTLNHEYPFVFFRDVTENQEVNCVP